MLRSSSTRAIVGLAYLLLIVRLLRLRSPEMRVSQCFEVLSKDNWQCKLAAMANWQSERHGLLTQRAGRSFHCLCNARNWRFSVRVSLQFPNVFLSPGHSLSPLSFLSHLILPKQQVSNTSNVCTRQSLVQIMDQDDARRAFRSGAWAPWDANNRQPCATGSWRPRRRPGRRRLR